MKDTLENNLAFSAVPYGAVDIVWSDVEPMLKAAAAASGGRFEVEHIKSDIDNKVIALWVVLENTSPVAAVTSRLVEYPNTRALGIDWIGGSRAKEWLPMVHSTLLRYARDNGCTFLEAYGRKGWIKMIAQLGWKPDIVTYRMDLTDGQEQGTH